MTGWKLDWMTNAQHFLPDLRRQRLEDAVVNRAVLALRRTISNDCTIHGTRDLLMEASGDRTKSYPVPAANSNTAVSVM